MNNRDHIIMDTSCSIKTTETIINCTVQLIDIKLEDSKSGLLGEKDLKEVKAMLESACERLDIIHNEFKLVKK